MKVLGIVLITILLATPAQANWFKKNWEGFTSKNCWEYFWTAGQAGNKHKGKKCKAN